MISKQFLLLGSIDHIILAAIASLGGASAKRGSLAYHTWLLGFKGKVNIASEFDHVDDVDHLICVW